MCVWGGASWKSWLSQPVEQTMASPSGSLPLMTSPGKQQLKTRRPQRDTDIEYGGYKAWIFAEGILLDPPSWQVQATQEAPCPASSRQPEPQAAQL